MKPILLLEAWALGHQMAWATRLLFLMALTPCLVSHSEVTRQTAFSILVRGIFTAHEQWLLMAHLEAKASDRTDHMCQDRANNSGLLSVKGKDSGVHTTHQVRGKASHLQARVRKVSGH